MRSVATPPDDDRTAKARIRDAAIDCFAASGVAGTTVRAIAAEAEVSPGLVIHHFESMEGLRAACDEHVAAIIREGKRNAMAQGAGMDPLAALRAHGDRYPALMQYLARTLAEGNSPRVAALVDELVAAAVDYMRDGVETGALRPTAYPYGRAAVLTAWSLGALVLHKHVERLLGADLTGDPSEAGGYLRPATEVLSDGVVTEAVARRLQEALADGDTATEQPSRSEETAPWQTS